MHHATSSIGVARFQGIDANEEVVLQQADVAMYCAKQGGRNRICFFGTY